MAKKATDNSTPITLISLAEARDLVAATLLSKPWAEPQIIKWLHQRLIGWQYERVFGLPRPGRTREQEAEDLWGPDTLVDFQEGLARKVTLYRANEKDGQRYNYRPMHTITVIGIRVVRENIEYQLTQIPRVLLGGAATGSNQLRGSTPETRPQSPPAPALTEQPQQLSGPPKRKRKKRSVLFAGQLMAITFPQGQWQDMEPTEVHRRCGKDPAVKAKLRETEKPLPSLESFARAMGRRE